MGLNLLQIKTAKAIVSVFETGRVDGDCGAVAVLTDGAGISYGKHQATLRSGNLAKLIIEYYIPLALPANAQLLDPYLQRLLEKDMSLNDDRRFKDLLRTLGREDPAMRTAQERMFDRQFWDPACEFCEAVRLKLPLSHAVVYDSWIQGSFERVRKRVREPLPVRNGDEVAWLKGYLEARVNFLANGHSRDMRVSVYRPKAFQKLLEDGKLQLELPFTVNGVLLTEEKVMHG